jgi:hypothetical protein
MRLLVAVALAGVTAAAAPAEAAGQWRSQAPVVYRAQAAPVPTVSPVGPTLLSLALPGAGQHVLGQNRKWVYLALEVAGWAFWAERRAAAFDYRDRYRDFAWDAGRIQTGTRVDGDFDYYERLTKWARSGEFDADPASEGVQPELDASTYNGSIWSLAAQIFLPPGQSVSETDPAYEAALAYYQERAYGTALLWDWTGAPEGREELARLIRASDSRFGHATTALGVVIANHLVSAADAYLSARGRESPARLRFAPAGALGFGGHGRGWLAVVSIGVGR